MDRILSNHPDLPGKIWARHADPPVQHAFVDVPRVIDRFMLGASPRMVADWIFEYPDEQRGGIQELKFDTVRQYLQLLAEDVERQKRLKPPPPDGRGA